MRLDEAAMLRELSMAVRQLSEALRGWGRFENQTSSTAIIKDKIEKRISALLVKMDEVIMDDDYAR